MKKKIILIVVASFMIMGVVSAASLWGSYKGKEIIRLTVDGVPVKVSDSPAVSMDGRTMIPIYLLKQAGINYTWDQKNKTVNIVKQVVEQPTSVNKFFSVQDIAKSMKQFDIKGVEFLASEGTGIITYHYEYGVEHLNARIDRLNEIFKNSASTDATTTRILYPDGSEFMVSTSAIKDFFAGKITTDEFSNAYQLTRPNNPNSNQSNNSVTHSENNNPTPTPIPAATPTPTPTPTPNSNKVACENLRGQYNTLKSTTDFGISPFPDRPTYAERMFEEQWSETFAANGC